MTEIRPMQEAPTNGTPIYLVIETRRNGPGRATAVRAIVRAHFERDPSVMDWVIESWTFPLGFEIQFTIDTFDYLRTLHTKVIGWLPVYWRCDEEPQS